MRQRLRICLAGAGWVSEHHLQAWARTKGATVVALCDSDLEKAKAIAQRFGIERVFADAATMLEQCRPDALDIAASLAAHDLLCRLAADCGVHILCQKPLRATLAEARETVAAVGDRVRFMVHENWRFRPHYRRIRAWLDAGLLGRVQACQMRVRASGLWPDAEGRFAQIERQPFFATQQRLLVGEVLVHHIDLVRWLLGGEPLHVLAARSARLSPGVQGEDVASIVLAGARGWATIDGNLTSPAAPSKATDSFELIGTRGTASFENDTLRLRCEAGARSEDTTFDAQQAYRDSYAGAIAHFVQALREDRPFETPPAEHLAVLALVEDVYRAFASNELRSGAVSAS